MSLVSFSRALDLAFGTSVNQSAVWSAIRWGCDSFGVSFEHHTQLPCTTNLLPNAKLGMIGARRNGFSQFSCCRFEEQAALHAHGWDDRIPSRTLRYQISQYQLATEVALYRTLAPSRRGGGLGCSPVKRMMVVEIKLDSGNIPHLVTAILSSCRPQLIY